MKLQNMSHIRVPLQPLQLDYPRQRYLPSNTSTTPNEPIIVKLRAKITEIVKRKLKLGAKFQPNGVEKILQHHLSVKEGEKLLKTSKCYISTTAGPILGFLFITTHKVAFCSEKPIMFPSTSGDCVKVNYKVVIPIGKLSNMNKRRTMKKPSEKYIEIVTVDNFDFWFLGLNCYQKTLKYLQQSKFQVE